mmetsp:Transcript_17624/g.42785  ORF Transcript_17624/g.42785 Transcript_17624/m.42785 type:complete len:256 (+) Transcript_17624:46-813(+)
MARGSARAWWAGLAGVWAVACVATVLLVDDGGGSETVLVGEAGLAATQMLAYKKYVPDENPLESFDSDFKQGAYKKYVPEANPLASFDGYGFSTTMHAKGEHPYPPTPKGGGYDTHNVYDDINPKAYPFDERKDGLKESFHKWHHWDWKKSPSKAIAEPNVYDTAADGPEIKDSAWQLNDPMSFKWHHWDSEGTGQDAAIKALHETNVYDNPEVWPQKYHRWKNTPASTVQDAQEDEMKPGQESNVFMNIKFPDY